MAFTEPDLHKMAVQAENSLLEHGDPLGGDDYAAMQVIRAWKFEHDQEPLDIQYMQHFGWYLDSHNVEGDELPAFRYYLDEGFYLEARVGSDKGSIDLIWRNRQEMVLDHVCEFARLRTRGDLHRLWLMLGKEIPRGVKR